MLVYKLKLLHMPRSYLETHQVSHTRANIQLCLKDLSGHQPLTRKQHLYKDAFRKYPAWIKISWYEEMLVSWTLSLQTVCSE